MNAADAKVLLLYENVAYIGETAFLDSGDTGTYPSTSVNLVQGYIVGYVNSDFATGGSGHLATSNYAIILPTLHDESCVVPTQTSFDLNCEIVAGSLLEVDNVDMFDTDLYYEDEVPPTSTYNPGLTSGTKFTLYDVQFSDVYRNDLCTDYDTEVTAFNPPMLLDTGTYCDFQYDREDYYIDFDPPLITAPSCSDSGNFWTTWIEPLDPYDSLNDFRVSIDIETSKIRVTSVRDDTSVTFVGVDFLAHFTLPTGVDYTFKFRIEDSSQTCTPTLTPPAFTAEHNYMSWIPQQTYAIDEWTTSNTGCAITYTTAFSGGTPDAPLSTIFTELSNNRGATLDLPTP